MVHQRSEAKHCDYNHIHVKLLSKSMIPRYLTTILSCLTKLINCQIEWIDVIPALSWNIVIIIDDLKRLLASSSEYTVSKTRDYIYSHNMNKQLRVLSCNSYFVKQLKTGHFHKIAFYNFKNVVKVLLSVEKYNTRKRHHAHTI